MRNYSRTGRNMIQTNSKVQKNYIQVTYLEYQGREKQYFQLQFVEMEVNENANAAVYFKRILWTMTRNCISNIKHNSIGKTVGNYQIVRA